jgi:tetratricopeptide (TPR) repeat protein
MSEATYNLNLQNTPVGAIGDHNQVTQNFIVQSPDYQALMARIEDKRSLLELQTDPSKKSKTAEELEQLEAQLEQFKENIFRLYELFSKIEINTERLRQAKDYFEQGQFREADAILQAEEMVKDLNKLEQKDQQLDQQKAEVRASREQIANEFLIKAQLWATFYEQSNRFEQTCEYFAESLRALKTTDNLFAYAHFLQKHYQLDQANLYYTEALEIYRNLGDLPLVAMMLNNLAVLHWNKNEILIAEQEYQEALQIRRELAVENPRSFLPDVAMTLNNLAILHQNKNEIAIAEQEYQEALQVTRELAVENPRSFLPYVATTLNNLAILHKNKNEMLIAEQEYQEALQIYQELAVENPRSFLPDVAMTLNNLAILHTNKNEMVIAEQEYQEALQIYRELAVENPRSFLPDVAMTLNNLAVLHKNTNEMAIALTEYQEALQIYRELAVENPRSFLQYVAMTLNNLAILQKNTNEMPIAEQKYQEALQIYQELAVENPRSFLQYVATTLLNLSIFYLQAQPASEKSFALAQEVIEIAQQFPDLPSVQHYAEQARAVLQAISER